MFIFDTHMHATEHDPATVRPQGITETADEHVPIMQAAGVDAAVLVHMNTPYSRYDPSYEASKVRQYAGRFACVYALNPVAPDVRQVLSRWVRSGDVAGIRIFNKYPAPDHTDSIHIDDPEGLDLVRFAAQLGVPITVMSTPHTLPRVADAARGCPEAKIIIDHMGLAMTAEALEPFAALPNIDVKFSTGALLNRAKGDEGQAVDLGRTLLRALVPLFGAERFMFGTNYPNTQIPLRRLVDMALQMLDFLPHEERAMLMGRNALRYWKPRGLERA